MRRLTDLGFCIGAFVIGLIAAFLLPLVVAYIVVEDHLTYGEHRRRQK